MLIWFETLQNKPDKSNKTKSTKGLSFTLPQLAIRCSDSYLKCCSVPIYCSNYLKPSFDVQNDTLSNKIKPGTTKMNNLFLGCIHFTMIATAAEGKQMHPLQWCNGYLATKHLVWWFEVCRLLFGRLKYHIAVYFFGLGPMSTRCLLKHALQ